MNLLAELDGSLKAKTTYVHGPGIDQPLIMADGREKYFYQTDAIGTITGLTDSSGKPAVAYEADAFGGPTRPTGNIGNPFVFTARQFDADLGIYYFRGRGITIRPWGGF